MWPFKYIVLSISLITLLTIPIIVEASHTIFSQSVGISLSKTCLTYHKNNITNPECPFYDDIIQLDTSNRHISGDFEIMDGYLQRGKAQTINHWNYYNYDKEIRVFVDPPADIRNRIRMIEIGGLDQYPTIEDLQLSATNKTLTIHHSIWVQDDCEKAAVNGAIWQKAIPDMIFYMRNGCDDKFKLFNNVIEQKIEFVEHDITTSRDYQHKKWLEETMEKCREKC